MPIPNDFRLNGALGGWMAGEEYTDEQKKQELANLLTQANTAQLNQGTDEKAQLLPLLLQQREQENQIRAKEALAAQLGMANVPQEIANQGLQGLLTGKGLQYQNDTFADESKIKDIDRQTKLQQAQAMHQLQVLEELDRVDRTEGTLSAASLAHTYGINPEVYFNPASKDKIQEAIRHLRNQLGWSPAYKQAMDTAGVQAEASITTTRMNNASAERIANTRASGQVEAAKARQQAEAKAPGLEKEYVARKTAWENAGKPSEGPIAESYDKAHFDFFTNQNMRQPAQFQMQADGTIAMVTGPQRPIPDSGIKKGGSTSSGQGSGNGTPKRIKFDAQGNVIK